MGSHGVNEQSAWGAGHKELGQWGLPGAFSMNWMLPVLVENFSSRRNATQTYRVCNTHHRSGGLPWRRWRVDRACVRARGGGGRAARVLPFITETQSNKGKVLCFGCPGRISAALARWGGS